MYIVIGHHGRDDQCITVSVANVMHISITGSNVVHIPFELVCRPLVQTVNVGEQSVLGLSKVAISSSPRFSDEMRSSKDGPDFERLGSPVTNVVLKVPIMDEFFALILKHDALLCGMADILEIPIVLVLISFGAISSQWVEPLVDPSLLGCQEDLLM